MRDEVGQEMRIPRQRAAHDRGVARVPREGDAFQRTRLRVQKSSTGQRRTSLSILKEQPAADFDACPFGPDSIDMRTLLSTRLATPACHRLFKFSPQKSMITCSGRPHTVYSLDSLLRQDAYTLPPVALRGSPTAFWGNTWCSCPPYRRDTSPWNNDFLHIVHTLKPIVCPWYINTSLGRPVVSLVRFYRVR